MEPVASLLFAQAVRSISVAARSAGLTAPTFRSPPGPAGAHRTVRRRPDGSVVIAVQLRDRPWPAVLADLIEGVVVANRLEGSEAERCRAHLWPVALDAAGQEAA